MEKNSENRFGQLCGAIFILSVLGILFAPATTIRDYAYTLLQQTFGIVQNLGLDDVFFDVLWDDQLYAALSPNHLPDQGLSGRVDVAACCLVAFEMVLLRMALALTLAIPGAFGAWYLAVAQAKIQKKNNDRVLLERRILEGKLRGMFGLLSTATCFTTWPIEQVIVGMMIWLMTQVALIARERTYKSPN